MVTEVLTHALIGLIEGVGAGALGAYLGWASSTEAFIARKFSTGIVCGAIGGLLAAFGNLMLFQNVTDDLALLAIYGDIFASGLVATWGVPKVAGAVATRITGTTETTPATT